MRKSNARLSEIHGFAYLSRGRFAFIEGGAGVFTDKEKRPFTRALGAIVIKQCLSMFVK